MTAAQTAMYFAEWGKVRQGLRDQGKSSAECETHRRDLTRKALGHQKSSKYFTNAELDKVLAAIKAQSGPADFNSQMRVQDSPDIRRAAMMEKCKRACWEMYQLGDNGMANHDDAYIAGTARNVVKKPIENCTAEDLAVVLGCLMRKLGVMQKKKAAEDAARLAPKPVRMAEVAIASPTKQLIAGEDY